MLYLHLLAVFCPFYKMSSFIWSTFSPSRTHLSLIFNVQKLVMVFEAAKTKRSLKVQTQIKSKFSFKAGTGGPMHVLSNSQNNVFNSVEDPDPVFLGHPDPGKYRIRTLYPQKTLATLIFSLYKIVYKTVSSK